MIAQLIKLIGDLEKIQNGGTLLDGAEADCFGCLAINPVAFSGFVKIV
jgi:hypothetical protein